jgi:hypothetical protein
MESVFESRQRWVFRCPVCRAFKVLDLVVGVGEGIERWDLETGRMNPSTWETERRCPCGADAVAEPVHGSYSTHHVCDPRCTDARAPWCDCSCGGRNHGASWAGRPVWHIVFCPDGARRGERVVEATPETIAQAQAQRAEREQAKREATRQEKRRRVEDRREEYGRENPDLVAWLVANADDESEFVRDMAVCMERYGELTPRQERAVAGIMERQVSRRRQHEAWRARLCDAPELRAGRRQVQGRIVTVSWRRGEGFGTVHDPRCGCQREWACDAKGTWKMVVEEAAGNRLYLTVPRPLTANAPYSGDHPWWSRWIVSEEDARSRVGLEVHFASGIEPSADDPHFGFAARPTGLKVVSEAGATGAQATSEACA